MERLTKKIINNAAVLVEASGIDDHMEMAAIRQRALKRLAAYEDTGLEPEDILSLCEMDKRAKMADMLRLEEYQAVGSVSEFRALKEAEKIRQEDENKLFNPAGEYALKFAKNHGISIAEAMEKPMVKARFAYFADTGM